MKLTPPLARKFIERGIIRENTEVDIKVRASDLSGRLLTESIINCYLKTVKINDQTGDVFMTLTATADGTPYKVTQLNIDKIDGMEVSRIAENYFLDADGNEIPEGPRRGRRPNLKMVDESDEADYDYN